ncbi:tetratricopeptide repeat protein [Phaeobacter sp. QD34_3]|uniref:O-linked N-acetylglucosamine transferase, SPINDLY family protein n=1 Tax=unclassified Phaeobacter TaxID=2621772 RepID=UPI00237F2CC1|nr:MULTISPECIES: glycosyltransferase family 41 protein [unclassified Phaeobacter]MDE4134878.1 tetratricopeptide repeat protein [Phaeobacter sp. QD34_3]MDE4138526.1 tetratricopeptide repeat protein [Phaeobacter sp. QD34_24]MDE4176564.1 tetratricopeptide repeat protein [Phaeobacter sp. PT47_59]
MTIATSLNKAQRLERNAKLDDAALVYSDILSKYPKNTRARKALDSLQQRMQSEQNPPTEVQKKLAASFAAGQYQATASSCASLLNTYRRSHFLWDTLGQCHLKAGNLDEAATCLNKACELNPRAPGTYAAMAEVCNRMGRTSDAIALYRKSLSLDGNHLVSLNNLANILSDQDQMAEAVDLLERASKLCPDNPKLIYNFANTLRRMGKLAEAKQLYEKASELSPDLTEARFNLGQIELASGNQEDAIRNFEAVLDANPGDDRARAQKLHMKAQINDWDWVDEYGDHRRNMGLQGVSCSPFIMMTLEDNPDLLRLRTQAYANEKLPSPAHSTAARPAQRPQKLRIGYLSADFQDHATMHLMGGLFAKHDSNRFEITAYSYGTAPSDEARSRVARNVARFRDVAGMPDRQLIETVQADGLDIAIDLKGYTGETRCELFAERLAPLHVSYLGYPGTMGSTAFDYLIGDPVTCPLGSERFFEEHLIRMPHSYQVNDRERIISGQQFTRRDCGLPDDGVVFCCFNNSYKITPREYDIWMRLLNQTPGSTLWLLDTGALSRDNLRREAKARGIDPDRLVFAPRIAQAEHLARHRVADLFLDTFTMNAHTTASDALWAGLPVLTMPGRQFASRVGASLVSAVGLPEMIVKTEAEYEEKALTLAHDLEALAALRGKLMRTRLSSPLFDTEGFARDLEQGFDMIFDRYLKGLPPAHVDVPAFKTRSTSPGGEKVSAAA